MNDDVLATWAERSDVELLGDMSKGRDFLQVSEPHVLAALRRIEALLERLVDAMTVDDTE